MGPLMIEITDRAARVRYVKELWSQLTIEERQEVIAGDLLPMQVIKVERPAVTQDEMDDCYQGSAYHAQNS